MFASIPGFDTLYSEDDINHMGMEWLRLLNEMFHEFDMVFTPFEVLEWVHDDCVFCSYWSNLNSLE